MNLAYLAALLLSFLGVGLLDRKLRLAYFAAPGRTLAITGFGTAFFLAWDVAGITSGVFLMGDSPYMSGIALAPEMPLEEPIFLAFLSYLALVLYAAFSRPSLSPRRGRVS